METPLCPISEEERLREVRSIRWNIVLIAVSALLVTSPITALMNSTTSLLEDDDLGITSLTASSIPKFLATTFLLVHLNKILGMRKMVTITLMLHTPFCLSFIYPSWGTAFPAAVLMGLGMSFYTSMHMYGCALGYYYTRLTNGELNTVLITITALLSISLGSGYVLGNGILFAVLDVNLDEDNTTVSGNNSYSMCGPQYCNEDLTNKTTMKKPDAFRYYTLVAIFVSMCTLGGILSLFVRDFSNEVGCTLRKISEYFEIFKETLVLLARPRGFLLIILSIFMGLEETFKASVYTHAYVSCTVGIAKVGLIMMAYGGTHIIICLSVGFFARIFGRFLLIVFSVCLLLGCCVALLLWQPQPDQIGILFGVIVVWGVSSSFSSPSIHAMYAILFKDNIEGALALGNFWRALGYMMAFIWSQYFCVRLKLYIIMAFGCFGLALYILLEVILRRNADTLAPTDNPEA